MAALMRASWPDNLRELDGTIHRLVVEAEGAMVLTPRLCVGDLSFLVARPRRKTPLQTEEARQAMAQAGGKSSAARLLGVSRWTVDRVLRQAEARGE
jgi:transcriptional regulator of acetoin/glycerol metabolism